MQVLAPDLLADGRELSVAVTGSGLGLGLLLWLALGSHEPQRRQALTWLMNQRGKPTPFTEVAAWPVDVFLWLLLVEALLLYRSASEMGSGYIGRCWKALAVGVFLVSLGVVAMSATSWGYLPWPWSSVVWYVWLPAATAFALGPAYQLEAIQQVYAAPHRGPSNP